MKTYLIRSILLLSIAISTSLAKSQIITDASGDTLFYINLAGDIEFRGQLTASVTNDLYLNTEGDTLGWIQGDSILCCNDQLMGSVDSEGAVKLWSNLPYGQVESNGDIKNIHGDIVANRGLTDRVHAVALCLFFFETYYE